MNKHNTLMTKFLIKLILSIMILFGFNSHIFAKGKIGFACGYAGSPTESVILIDSLLKSKDFNKIRRLLNSNDDGKKCLSVIVCEILELKKLVELTEKEREIIKNAYESNEKIRICAGCTYYGDCSMKDVLNENDIDGWGFSNSIKQLAKNRYEKLIE